MKIQCEMWQCDGHATLMGHEYHDSIAHDVTYHIWIQVHKVHKAFPSLYNAFVRESWKGRQ